jgi:hypothetical protein
MARLATDLGTPLTSARESGVRVIFVDETDEKKL